MQMIFGVLKPQEIHLRNLRWMKTWWLNTPVTEWMYKRFYK